MNMQQKERFMYRLSMLTLFVLGLWMALWGLTGSEFFALCSMFTPFVALMILAWKAGLFKRNASGTR